MHSGVVYNPFNGSIDKGALFSPPWWQESLRGEQSGPTMRQRASKDVVLASRILSGFWQKVILSALKLHNDLSQFVVKAQAWW